MQKTYNHSAKHFQEFCPWGHEFYLKPYINKGKKIFARGILNTLNAMRAPHLIKITGIICVYQASEQLICSQFKHDKFLQLEQTEFTKLRVFHVFVPSRLTGLRVFVPYVPSHLRALRAFIFTLLNCTLCASY